METGLIYLEPAKAFWLFFLIAYAAAMLIATARCWSLRKEQAVPPSGKTPLKIEELRSADTTPSAGIPVTVAQPEKKVVSWLERLSFGLSKSRQQLKDSLNELFLSKEDKKTRDVLLENIFEILVTADVGVATSELLVENLKKELAVDDWLSSEKVLAVLKRHCVQILEKAQASLAFFEPQAEIDAHAEQATVTTTKVVMMVGVNGVGKTTTTGKLAFKVFQQGNKAVVGAADTFRAAAVEQLAIWAERSNAELVKLKEGADPASVAFEAVKLANTKKAEFCFVDTAGRLHNRNDLMQELAKIKRVMGKEISNAPHEVLLVLDATTGQNAIVQARVFKEIAGVTGVVLTKLDGTAKGGVALAIAQDLQLPIRFIGVGEGVEDLQPFCAADYVDALLGVGGPSH